MENNMKDSIKSDKKMKIAFFANSWNGENLDSFICGLRDVFIDDADVFVFSSAASFSQSLAMRDAENSIFFMPDYSFFNAAIILGSGITSYETTELILKKCREAGIPVVIQGMEVEGVSSVTIDNYIGMKELCNHLIDEHQVKDAVFIGGTSDNVDTRIRLEALRDALKEHGYELKNENVFYADWERSRVEDYISERYMDRKEALPDAIICANDPMALYAVLMLESIGYEVPDNVIVTGFDNMREGSVFYPSISSVDQRYREQGNLCAKYALELIADHQRINKTMLPCTAMPGESCGCSNCKNELRERRKLGHGFPSGKVAASVFSGRIAHLEWCIMSSNEYKDISDNMSNDLLASQSVEGEDFHIYINPGYQSIKYLEREGVEPLVDYSPVMDVIAARTDGSTCEARSLNIKELILGYTGRGIGKIYVFHSLKIRNSIMGYMVMGYTDNAFVDGIFDDFRKHICSALDKYQSSIKLARLNEELIKKNEIIQEDFKQTVLALASAVDTKDKYTHGHSERVADYSRQIARIAGKDEETCEEIHFAALLHDVGKIGIADSILNKEGKLTDEEFEAIKQHPEMGYKILMEASTTQYLAIGAHYHHERYDGKGYPSHLKGEEIPDIARIIAVSDAYDAMTSKRSYRDPMPQEKVREELVKGIGSQFDPIYAKIMIQLVDEDKDYRMREL